jgi:hypothetical protein
LSPPRCESEYLNDRLQSDFDVCLECGSADECEHDRADQADGMKRSPSSSDVRAPRFTAVVWLISPQQVENTCEMVTNAFIPAGAEVFNIYGPLLGNAQLICHYGFALDGNEHDVVSWDAAELADALPSTLHETQRRYAAELREWRQDAPSWEDSDLIFVIDRRESSPARSHLVDADGCISRELWIWAAATALAQETSSMNTLPAAANLADEQIRLERQLEVEDQMDEDDEHESGALDDEHDPVAIVYLLIIFEVLTSIIVTRETKLRRGKSLEEIESLLDVSSSTRVNGGRRELMLTRSSGTADNTRTITTGSNTSGCGTLNLASMCGQTGGTSCGSSIFWSMILYTCSFGFRISLHSCIRTFTRE